MAFFSYARLDLTRVRPMAAATRLLGIRTWLDLEDLHPGDPWRTAVAQAVRVADLVVCCVSKASLASFWTGEEIGHALEHDKTILPVVLEPTPMHALPEALLRRQVLDVSTMDAEQAAAACAEVVARMLARAPDTRPPECAIHVRTAGYADGRRSPTVPVGSLADLAAAIKSFEGQPVSLTVDRHADAVLAAAAISALAHDGRDRLSVNLHPQHVALEALLMQLAIRFERLDA